MYHFLFAFTIMGSFMAALPAHLPGRLPVQLPSVKDSVPKTTVQKKIPVRPKALFGYWSAIGDENVTFIITTTKIAYPDLNSSYSYIPSEDTLTIKYDGFQIISWVRMPAPDTLIIIPEHDDPQVFYRFKKSRK